MGAGRIFSRGGQIKSLGTVKHFSSKLKEFLQVADIDSIT